MSPHAPKTNKLPFIITDLVFIAVAAVIIFQSARPIGSAQIFAAVVCVALGAWAVLTPFLKDHEVMVRLAEADHLSDTVSEIRKLKNLANQIQTSTAHWQTLQENSDQAKAAMEEMATRLSKDAKDFAATLQKANDSEKQNLRLELEKMKRGEREHVEIVVALLDNVHALYAAGVRSQQENVIRQLTTFQGACRDVVRRIGLVPVEAQPGDLFDPKLHQTQESKSDVAPGTPIVGAVATGYRYQGRLIRPVPVVFEVPPSNPPAGDLDESETPSPSSDTEPGAYFADEDRDLA